MTTKSIYEEFVEKIKDLEKQEEDTSQILNEIKHLFDTFINKEIKLKKRKQSFYENLLQKIKEFEEQENLFCAVIEHIETLYSQLAKSQVELEEKHRQLLDEIKKREIMEKELLKAKEEAEIASKAKSDFLAKMSHEIRTPLTGIVGFIELLNQTHLTGLQRRYVEIIKSSVQSLLVIVNDILDMAKIEEGKYELGYTNVNPYLELDQIIKVFTPEAEQKNLNYIYNFDPCISECLIFPVQALRQILNNLISNAIKFTDKGEVEIKIEVVKDKENSQILKFEVRDTGIGIPEEKLKDIFEKFSQIYRDRASNYSGTGLGLSIASSLVKMIGGELKVKSKVGEGSTFYFTAEFEKCIPEVSINELYRLKNVFIEETEDSKSKEIAHILDLWKIPFYHLKLEQISSGEKHFDVGIFFNIDNLKKFLDLFPDCSNLILISDEAIEIEDEKIKVTSSKLLDLYNVLVRIADVEKETEEKVRKRFKAKVLVVEDNEIARILIEELLKKYSVEFDTVENGLVAINKVKKNRYDLIFMDISMPVMDGETAMKQIKKEFTNIPIIALTAHAFAGEKERLLKAGFDDYISKPISAKDLEKILEKYAKVEIEESYKKVKKEEPLKDVSFIKKAKLELGLSEKVLEKLVDKFFEALPHRLQKIEECLKERDCEKLAKVAHNFKGSSGSLRLDSLYLLSQKLEKKARMKEIETCFRLFENLKYEAKKLEEAYKSWKQEKRK